MRFEVELILDNNIINKDYRRNIVSVIKQCLSEEDYEEIYKERKLRSFTFSPFLQIDNFSKDKIILKDKKIKLFFSTDNMSDGWILINSFRIKKNKELNFGKNKIIVEKVGTLVEKEIKDDIILFKTMSPICIREQLDEKKSWYHDFDDKGIRILKKNIIYQLKYEFPRLLLEELKIKSFKMKKTIITNYDIQFPVNLGTLIISGDKRILKKLYKCGIGSKTSLGLGMLEIVQ
jgi:CRISPR-associated endoribonuclease Cas6